MHPGAVGRTMTLDGAGSGDAKVERLEAAEGRSRLHCGTFHQRPSIRRSKQSEPNEVFVLGHMMLPLRLPQLGRRRKKSQRGRWESAAAATGAVVATSRAVAGCRTSSIVGAAFDNLITEVPITLCRFGETSPW